MENIDKIAKIFASISDEELMKKFFSEIFTDKERKDISLRWELIEMIDKGVPQRQIASDLGISLCKITRGSRILKDQDSVSKKILEAK